MRDFHVARRLLVALLALPGLAWAQQAPPPPPPPAPEPAPDPIPPVPQLEFADGKYQMLFVPMTWSIGASGVSITVPAGFVHDNASVPALLQSLLPSHGTYGKAAVVHDYLYWSQTCTRLQADNLLMVAMKESDVPPASRTAVYRGVRLGGGSAYRENRAARAAGIVRVVPPEFRELPATATWQQYQAMLRDAGVRDPEFPAQAGYCRLGDGVDVPEVPVDDEAPAPVP